MNIRPPLWNWSPMLVTPEYRELASKLIFAAELGWDTNDISLNRGPIDIISKKMIDDTGDFYSNNTFGLDNFGNYLSLNEVSYGNGFRWTTAQNIAWWVDGRSDIPTTIEAYVYLDSSIADTATNRIAVIGGSGAGYVYFDLPYDTDHWELQLARTTTSTYQSVRQTTAFPTDRWVHVVGVLPAFGFGPASIYIDGELELVGGGLGAGTATSGTTEFRISDPTAGSELTGGIAYVRVYKGLLEIEEIRSLSNDPFGPVRLANRLFLPDTLRSTGTVVTPSDIQRQPFTVSPVGTNQVNVSQDSGYPALEIKVGGTG